MKNLSARGIFIVTLASLFYAYEFLLQSSPGVITNQLLADFHLDAASLSIMAACFFYAYAPTQVVGGVLYDRFGPRLLLTSAVLVCACGAAFFAIGQHMWQLSLGRFCMGLGGAFSFVGVLVLASRWLPLKYFALIAGLLQTLGCIGAIVGQVPLAVLVDHYNWRVCFYWLFWIGVALALLYWLVIRNWPTQHEQTQRVVVKPTVAACLRQVFGASQTYWIALYSFAIWIPVVVFAALWGIPYIAALYHISVTAASTVGMMLWLGVAVGSPLFGVWSARIGRRCLPLSTSAAIALVTSLLILYVHMPLGLMYAVMFFFGVGASGQTLIFAVVQDIQPLQFSGTAMGFNNLAVVAGGALCQPLAGYLLHAYWDGSIANGIPVYSIADFKHSLLLLPLFALLAWVMSTFFIKETNCISKHS